MDFNLNDGDQFIDSTDYVIQQIEGLLDTTPGDLLGDMDYGSDYEYLLHDIRLNADNLASYVQEDLNGIELEGHEIEVSSMLLEGTEREIALVNMDITTPHDQHFNKTYNIR